MSSPVVALIGRPNVGKSTLLNRLSGKRLALVHDRPGVTRDCREVHANFYGDHYLFIDTPGLYDPGTDAVPGQISEGMRAQALRAISSADVVCFIVDGREGCTPYDYTLAEFLRKLNKPIIVLVNKSEGYGGLQGLSDAQSLGLTDKILPISAEHGEGISDFSTVLYQMTEEKRSFDFDEEDDDDQKNKPIKITIMGRPNVGKSTLFNTLVGEDKQLTGDLPGLTRDAITFPFTYNDTLFSLVDTAGIRKQSRVIDNVERLAVMDAKRALQYTEIVILVLDASIPFQEHLEKQDLTLAQTILEEGRAMIIALNKWDQVKDKKAYIDHIKNELSYQLAQAAGISVIPISALKQQQCSVLLDTCLQTYQRWNKRISTGQLNQWFDYAIEAHSPPIVKGQRIKLKYITQAKTRPPSFVVFGTKSKDIPESYQRYLVNRLREDFDLKGIPVRLHFKSPKNPYIK